MAPLYCVMVAVMMTSLPVTYALTSAEITALEAYNEVTVTTSGSTHTVTSDGNPNLAHTTGSFPTSYNPNSITTQSYSYDIPSSPSKASATSCLPMGPVGMSVTGSPFFNPLTADDNNAVEGDDAEEFDSCNGHPDMQGRYHYHKNFEPGCISEANQDDALLGVAFDGFPIYSKMSNGVELTSADLDDCHGRTYNGQYQYHVTEDCPYVLGCFSGTVVDSAITSMMTGQCNKVTMDSSYCAACTCYAITSLMTMSILASLFLK